MGAKARLAALIAAAMVPAAGAAAHHSYSAFDLHRDITVRGTVKSFAWEDPHSVIELVVLDADGKATVWSVEGAGPRRLTSRGWSVDSLKPGDRAEIVLNPSHDGAPMGRMVAAYVGGKRIGREGRE